MKFWQQNIEIMFGHINKWMNDMKRENVEFYLFISLVIGVCVCERAVHLHTLKTDISNGDAVIVTTDALFRGE